MQNNKLPQTIIGVAIGDSLGMPFETLEFDHPTFSDWKGEFRSSDYHKLGPGQYTDDTMMTKLLAMSLVSKKGFDSKDVSEKYVSWLISKENRGMGKTTQTALNRLKYGIPTSHSGLDVATNGAAMRASPIGVYFRGDSKTIVDICKNEASITHNNLEAIAGSMAVALAVSFLIAGCTKKELISEIINFLPDSSVKNSLKVIGNYPHINEPYINKNDLRKLSKLISYTIDRCGVIGSLSASFLSFLGTTSFKDSLETVIRAGGDTDTHAAICGALGASFYEEDQLYQYISFIEDYEILKNLNNSLYSI